MIFKMKTTDISGKCLYNTSYFWSMEPQRESASEGHVEEGVRVALLKLVTDGSRPRAERSDSYDKERETDADDPG